MVKKRVPKPVLGGPRAHRTLRYIRSMIWLSVRPMAAISI